ncbi:hypothetical protein [Haladaptatus sp. NG-WS-4]
MSLLPAVIVAAILVVIARVPILQSRGTVRLRTDDQETVVDEFTGSTPPVLALQWGAADEVTTGENTATYHISYLFGLRSAELTVQTQTETTPTGDHRVGLEITMNDQPWATYTSTISSNNGQTLIDVEYTADRRFGLRSIPQQFFTERYRDDVLTAQGYTIVERDAHFGL